MTTDSYARRWAVWWLGLAGILIAGFTVNLELLALVFVLALLHPK